MHQIRLEIYASPLPIPFSFAYHTWIVFHGADGKDRYEVWQKQGLPAIRWGHVYQNLFSLYEGIRIFYVGKRRFTARLLYSTVLSIESHPGRMIQDLIERYPYKYKYWFYPGPNSNTFVQWILYHLNLEKKFTLPARALGKNFIREIPN